jgi:hypothetical protein
VRYCIGMTSDTDPDITPTTSRRDHYAAMRSACDRLDAAIADTDPQDEHAWAERVQKAARTVFIAIERHREITEGPDGTLADMSQQKPALVNQVERQHREHLEMLQRAKEIDTEVERQIAFQEFNLELLRLEASVLRDTLRLHIYRADALLYEAYFREEGGEEG